MKSTGDIILGAIINAKQDWNIQKLIYDLKVKGNRGWSNEFIQGAKYYKCKNNGKNFSSKLTDDHLEITKTC